MGDPTSIDRLPARYLELARACKAAYAAPINHRKLSYDGSSFTAQKIVHGRLGRGFCRIFCNDHHIVVALRGTRERADWIMANLRFLPVWIKGNGENRLFAPLVHRGFQSCLYCDDKTTTQISLDAIIDHIDTFAQDGNRRIVVTGHSLGGALAILLTTKIALLRPDLTPRIAEVVTFGAPATGFARLKALLGKLRIPITRIVNGVDLVSFLPPAFYQHVGDEIWLRQDRIERQPTWFRRMVVGRFGLKQGLQDHDINSYVQRLKQAI